VKACIDLNLTPLTVLSKWRNSLAHLAMQLNEIHQPVQQHSAGIDPAAGVLRTSRFDVSLFNGQISRNSTPTQLALFPLADGCLPNKASLQAILEHRQSLITLHALTAQLVNRCLGGRQLTVLATGQAAQFAHHLLNQCSLLDSQAPAEIQAKYLDTRISKTTIKEKLVEEHSWWANAGKEQTHWLAAQKPVIYLGRRCPPRTEIPPIHSQRLLLLLLSQSLQAIHNGENVL
jgi:hypothetical protein